LIVFDLSFDSGMWSKYTSLLLNEVFLVTHSSDSIIWIGLKRIIFIVRHYLIALVSIVMNNRVLCSQMMILLLIVLIAPLLSVHHLILRALVSCRSGPLRTVDYIISRVNDLGISLIQLILPLVTGILGRYNLSRNLMISKVNRILNLNIFKELLTALIRLITITVAIIFVVFF
jgi:hypothetical protein